MALDLSSLSAQATQEEFAAMIGVTQQRVGQLIAEGVLAREGSVTDWLLSYCERLREQAAGRGQELTIERAALARSQRVGQDIKNAVAQRAYAPIALLTDVLAEASAAVAARFDALAGDLQRRFPNLNDDERADLMTIVAAARNTWTKESSSLTARKLDELVDEEPGPDIADDLLLVDEEDEGAS